MKFTKKHLNTLSSQEERVFEMMNKKGGPSWSSLHYGHGTVCFHMAKEQKSSLKKYKLILKGIGHRILHSVCLYN